jgi:TolA-binding protein
MNEPQAPAGPEISVSALEADLFWEKNKKTILPLIVGVLALVVGASAWFAYDASSEASAREMLALADSRESFRNLIISHPRSNPAADALLLLAAEYRTAGELESSSEAFREFLERFPDHPLAGGALLGIGQNQEAADDQSAAATTYQQVLTQYPASYTAPFAAYAEAEILLRAFKRDEALKRYNMIVSEFPRSPVTGMAMQQLRRLGVPPNS